MPVGGGGRRRSYSSKELFLDKRSWHQTRSRSKTDVSVASPSSQDGGQIFCAAGGRAGGTAVENCRAKQGREVRGTAINYGGGQVGCFIYSRDLDAPPPPPPPPRRPPPPPPPPPPHAASSYCFFVAPKPTNRSGVGGDSAAIASTMRRRSSGSKRVASMSAGTSPTKTRSLYT